MIKESERSIVSYEEIKNNPQYEILSEKYIFDKEIKEYVLQSFEVRFIPITKNEK